MLGALICETVIRYKERRKFYRLATQQEDVMYHTYNLTKIGIPRDLA